MTTHNIPPVTTPAPSIPDDMVIVAATPHQYHVATCIAALQIEVRTGLKHSRGSVLAMCQREYGISARTKVKALAEMLANYEQWFGRPYAAHVETSDPVIDDWIENQAGFLLR